MTVEPGDRILCLGLPPYSQLAELTQKLSSGLVVVIAGDDEVRAARRAFAQTENIMFVPKADDGSIPWRDGFFTAVMLCVPGRPDEVNRVLAPGGRLERLSS